MRFRKSVLRVGISSLLLLVPFGSAQAAAVPQLVISQLKITSSSGQFITFYNQSDTTLDLSQYEVDYLNSTGKLSNLPVSGQLAAHSFYMLSDDQIHLCYQVTVNAVSLGLATTNGSLQVWQLSSDKTSKQLQDSVSWASKATAGAVTLPSQNAAGTVSLLRQPTDGMGEPQITAVGAGSWQAVTADASDPCNLDIVNTVTNTPSPTTNPGNMLGLGQAPPATIINVLSDDASGTTGPILPAADVGLAAPQLTELLPNPDGTGTDGTDEFIEIYNSNPVPFHLVGFTLQTGATTKHSYMFPDGTILPPQSFTAFYSKDTGLSLSNTSGQADLLDPFGNPLSQTEPYGIAKDGQAWALANGAWYWTSQPTPGTANVVRQVASGKSSSKKSSSKSSRSSSGAVKGASTSLGSSSSDSTTDPTAPAPIHSGVLVAVAALAVGYGLYEYRQDFADGFHKLRAHRRAG